MLSATTATVNCIKKKKKKTTSNFSGLKVHRLLSQFLWIRNPGTAQLSSLLQGHSQAAIKVLAGLSGSQGSAGKGSASKCMWLLAGFSSSGLLDREPQFLAGCWRKTVFSCLPRVPLQHGRLLHQSVQAGRAIEGVC